jgi:septation ring formation regulator EzrA
METNLVLSLSSIIGIFSLFWAWHKEQKQTTAQISVLENKVNNLAEKAKAHESVISNVQQTLQRMDLKLTRIDTQLSQLINNKNDD